MSAVNQQVFEFSARKIFDLLNTNPPPGEDDLFLVTTEIQYVDCLPVVKVYAVLSKQEILSDRVNGCPHPCPGAGGLTSCADAADEYINSKSTQ